jgi:hypothetical protein
MFLLTLARGLQSYIAGNPSRFKYFLRYIIVVPLWVRPLKELPITFSILRRLLLLLKFNVHIEPLAMTDTYS